MLDRLVDAINKHDIDALTACFSPDYVSTWPVHPARTFTGRDQVRRNWEMMFEARPDIKAAMTARAPAGDEAWAEWEFVGTERNGARFHQRGVIIAVVEDDVITRTRFYMEPVDAPLAQ
ncbi:nuclear transport factor 2 family protein [Amycolatopsis pigmentata]|uniref:Nuclear transport factor 2 family protein n=1 Tax=Amycolatopsis pigmentata TaxID=450801 RepID=A0ABW5FMX6_9PSEU